MKLVTFRLPDRTTRAGVVHDKRVIALDYPTVLELLRDSDPGQYFRVSSRSWV